MANSTKGLKIAGAREKVKEGMFNCNQKAQMYWDVNQAVIWYVCHNSKSSYERVVNFLKLSTFIISLLPNVA
jgi:hypothetical protein